jgi:EmrB/QacA subfamily drug resistance transporter
MAEYSDSERTVTLWAVMIVFLLSALDQTIVATAMPRIIADLNGLPLYSWVTTAYLLTSTVMVPIWGKLSDLFGRKPILLSSILFFVVGSWLSGLSGEFGSVPILGGGMTQLIVFRAVQGIGGGGLFTTAFAIIADIFPPRERARFGGLFGAVFGLASAIGPLVGGYLTDLGTTHLFGMAIAGWRWVFYVNLPLSLLSLFMILFKTPKMSHAAKGKVDVIGALLIVATVVPLLLALSLGGHSYAWRAPQVLGLFAAATAGLSAYVYAERFASDPILPIGLFRNRVFSTTNLAGFLISMSFMSTVSFLPLFMQLGQGVKPTTSGLTTLPLLGGLMLSAILSGRYVSRSGKYRALMIGSVAVIFVGIVLLTRMHAGTTRLDLAWRLLVLGIGLGPSQSIFSLVAQSALPQQQLGIVTAAGQFFRQIGATMGVALFGTFLTNHLNQGLGANMPGMDIGKLQAMSASGAAAVMPPFIRVIISTAVTDTFALGLYVVALAVIAVLLIPHVLLHDRSAAAASPLEKEAEIEGLVHL